MGLGGSLFSLPEIIGRESKQKNYDSYSQIVELAGIDEGEKNGVANNRRSDNHED